MLGSVATSTQVETAVGSSLLTAAPFSGPAAPFLAVAGGMAELLAMFGVGSGCGDSCVLSSAYANKAESVLQQNLTTYMGLPTPRSCVAQTTALNIFDTIWSDLVAQCSNPQLGTAGKNCISDRQRGACHYGSQSAGTCWNWFIGYRDPIANDVCSNSLAMNNIASPILSEASSLISSTGMDWTTILALGLVALGISRLG